MTIKNENLKIGDIARRSGLGIETLRYYEKIELLPIVGRTPSGYRLYNAETLDRIGFIQSAKDLGFTLNEIKEFLSLKQADGDDCHDVREQVVNKIRDVEEKISQLMKIKTSLNQLIESCDGHDAVKDCPILNHFNESRRDA